MHTMRLTGRHNAAVCAQAHAQAAQPRAPARTVPAPLRREHFALAPLLQPTAIQQPAPLAQPQPAAGQASPLLEHPFQDPGLLQSGFFIGGRWERGGAGAATLAVGPAASWAAAPPSAWASSLTVAKFYEYVLGINDAFFGCR